MTRVGTTWCRSRPPAVRDPLTEALDHVTTAAEGIKREESRIKGVLEDATAEPVSSLRYTLSRLDVARARLELAREALQVMVDRAAASTAPEAGA